MKTRPMRRTTVAMTINVPTKFLATIDARPEREGETRRQYFRGLGIARVRALAEEFNSTEADILCWCAMKGLSEVGCEVSGSASERRKA